MSDPAYRIHVVGATRAPLRDAFHAFLRWRWSLALAVIVAAWLTLNALFALGYLLAGGIAHARAGSFFDAYAFSVQTMGTIGYGAMYPAGTAAHALVILESVTSLIVTALATGLVFTKFARSTARVEFSRRAVICPLDGVPTLMVRFGNQRGNRIVDAALRIVLTRTERTAEGFPMYRMHDLELVRDRAPALQRSFTVLHRLDASSPLHGRTPAQLAAEDAELTVTIVGLDDTLSQTVHASHVYMDREILWGARHADILTELPNGDLRVDLRRFHDVEPTAPAPEFQYPDGGRA